MKTNFEILKDRLKIEIRISRDSVCAADDCHAPHEKTMTMHSFTDPKVLVNHIASSYLPSINGIGHTWDCILNGSNIATISTDGIQARLSEVVYEKDNHIHFIYHSSKY